MLLPLATLVEAFVTFTHYRFLWNEEGKGEMSSLVYCILL